MVADCQQGWFLAFRCADTIVKTSTGYTVGSNWHLMQIVAPLGPITSLLVSSWISSLTLSAALKHQSK